jgi:magnesium transporter
MLENYKEVVEALEATNESVISHNVNDVLRVLTIFSVFFLPLTLISGIFGMNNLIPGEGTALGFWVVIGVMVSVIAGMWFYFRKRDWL